MIEKAWKEFISLTHNKEFIPGTCVVILFFLTSIAIFPHANADAKISSNTLSTTSVHSPHTLPIPTITPKPTSTLSIQNNRDVTPTAILPTPTTEPKSAASSPAGSSTENTNTSSSQTSPSVSPIEIIPTGIPTPTIADQQNTQTEPTPTAAQQQNNTPTPTGLNQQITQTVQELSTVGGLTQ